MATHLLESLFIHPFSKALDLKAILPIAKNSTTVTYDFKFNFFPYPDPPIIVTGTFSYNKLCLKKIKSEEIFNTYSTEITDFQINSLGNIWTKAEAENFDITWNIDIPIFEKSTIKYFDSLLKGKATWKNPDFSLSFFAQEKFDYIVLISTPERSFSSRESKYSFTQRNADPTSVE
jgi:hypothetical protein